MESFGITRKMRPWRLSYLWQVGLTVVLAGLCAVHAQEPELQNRELERRSLPEGAVSREHAFVIAHGGKSFLFNPSAGIYMRPFLDGVHKQFGFSHDSRYFLYLKADNGFPTFTLVARDMIGGDEHIISTEGVQYASWSPTAHQVAFTSVAPDGEVRVATFDFDSGETTVAGRGNLNPGFLDWSKDGRELRYLAVTPVSQNSFHDYAIEESLMQFDLETETIQQIRKTDKSSGESSGFDVRAASANSAANAAEREGESVTVSGVSYVTVDENQKKVVKRLDPSSGELTPVAPGDIYTATDDGIVIREFGIDQTVYKYVDSNSSIPVKKYAFDGTYNMPFAGSAYFNQGGELFSDGSCDGRDCRVAAHRNKLGYALDFQQTPEDGQGNTHVLAVADGTVAVVIDTVTCNNVTPTCFVGHDDYDPSCNSNNGAGNVIVLAHLDGTYSLYAHLKSGSIQVVSGQAVTKGTYMADQGHSGSANGPGSYRSCGDHLHFQRQIDATVWGQSIPTDFVELPCSLSCLSAYASGNIETDNTPATALTVELTPSTLVGDGVTTVANRVILDTPAPAGGAVVTLSSSDPTLVPVAASVTVPAGAVAANFQLTSVAVSSPTPIAITANYSGSTAIATLTLVPVVLTQLTVTKAVFGGGTTVTGNDVSLTGPAGSSGAIVALTSSDPTLVSVPSSVTVAQGDTFAFFQMTSAPVATTANVTITASYGGVSDSVTLVLNDPNQLQALNISPTDIPGGKSTSTSSVLLVGPAPTGGANVTLTSSDPAVASVPANILIPEGVLLGSFVISTSSVTVATPVTITASYGGVTESVLLSINPPSPAALTLSPTQVVGGNSTNNNKVVLDVAAPAGGLTVPLSSSDPTVATTNGSVFVPAGSRNSFKIPITTFPVLVPTPVTISATLNGKTASKVLTVNPSAINNLTLNATSVVGGNQLAGNTVTLDAPAPTGGAAVTLISSNASIASVPPTLTVPAGSTVSPGFDISTVAVGAPAPVTISATYNGVTQTAALTVNPTSLSQITLGSSAVLGGSSTTTNTVSLDGPAPTGGAVVTLSSSDPAVAAVPPSVTILAGLTTSPAFSISTSAVLATTTVTITASYDGVNQSAVLTVQPSGLAGLVLNPASVLGGSPTNLNTVSLGSPAPTGGAVVTLTSSDPAVATVPGSVPVPAGATVSAAFTITTAVVTVQTPVTITADYGGTSQSAVLTVDSVQLSRLILNPREVGGGKPTVQNRVILDAPAPPGGVQVMVTSSDPAVASPAASVTVDGGQTSSNFFIGTSAVLSTSPVTISASLGGVTFTEVLTVNPVGAASLTLNQNVIVGGNTMSNNKVTLDAPAPTGGAIVTLTSSDPTVATTNGSVFVPAGSRNSFQFPITTAAVSTPTPVTISATLGGKTATDTLTVNPQAISAVTLSASSVIGGGQVTGNMLTLDAPAPAGGAIVALSSSTPSVASVPATVTVLAGDTVSPVFDISTSAVGTSTPVTISAMYNGVTKSAALTVSPTVLVQALLSPATVLGGGQTTANTVSLDGPAPASGALVTLSSSDTSVATVPASVTIPAGSTTSPAFTITTSPVGSTTTVTVTANYNGVVKTGTLTVQPSGLATLSLSPTSVTGGTSTTQNSVGLGAPAPSGGTVVTLSSSDPTAAMVPASVTIPAGSTTSPLFTITTSVVQATTLVTITADQGGVVRTAVLTVNAVKLSRLILNPTSVGGGKPTVQNSVILEAPAPPGGVQVTITSSDPAVASPAASVTVDGGQTSSNFFIGTSPVISPTPVTISASLGGVTETQTLTVNPVAVAAITLSPVSVASGGSTFGNKVTLDAPAPPGGATVVLSSSDPAAATPPPSIFIAAGVRISNKFAITTGSVATSTPVTISATYGGVTRTDVLTVGPLSLSGISLNPSTIGGGGSSSANTVLLNGPAPTGGVSVTLSSSDPAVAAVPASVTVPAGTNSSSSFTITTSSVVSPTQVTISATASGSTQTAVLTVTPPTVSVVTLNPVTLGSGGSSSANTVSLNGPAPGGGALILLSSSDPTVAAVPASVLVPAGATVSPAFSITAGAVAVVTNVTISASFGGVTGTAALSVTPITAASLVLNPNSAPGGKPTPQNQVYLTAPAPVGGAVVTFSSSNPALATPPPSITIPAGDIVSAKFTIFTTWVTAPTPVTISASFGGVTQNSILTLNPVAVAAVNLRPTTVVGGSTTGRHKVTLDANAPPSGALISLSSSDPSVAAVPATVVAVAGSRFTNQFTITTTPVPSNTPVTITATLNGVSKAAVLTVTP